jgi:SAM-dependent methyltransferase
MDIWKIFDSMNSGVFKKARDRLPLKLQGLIWKITDALRFFSVKIWLMITSKKNLPNPATIYWISPNRIVYLTNYKKVDISDPTSPQESVFPNNMRGKIIDGNWDIPDFKFADVDHMDAFKQRIQEGTEWKDTRFYKRFLKEIESGRIVWNMKNKSDLDQHCRHHDELYEKIKNEGYHLNLDKRTKIDLNEIDVNIGRNGEYLFQNGVHRLSIAKSLGIESVPVMVYVRHKQWQDFRERLIEYARLEPEGKLYQPPIHPDLTDIPYENQKHDWLCLMATIEKNLSKKNGLMLDIGANLGFFCHKFEDIGYQCYAIEQELSTFQFTEKIRIAENKKFTVINKSIIDVEFVKTMEFDVVLALNIFHWFLQTKTSFSQLKDLLRDLKTTEMFFEPHLQNENQMKNAYINFNETEFVDFILQHTSLNKASLIYTDPCGRQVFKLSK